MDSPVTSVKKTDKKSTKNKNTEPKERSGKSPKKPRSPKVSRRDYIESTASPPTSPTKSTTKRSRVKSEKTSTSKNKDEQPKGMVKSKDKDRKELSSPKVNKLKNSESKKNKQKSPLSPRKSSKTRRRSPQNSRPKDQDIIPDKEKEHRWQAIVDNKLATHSQSLLTAAIKMAIVSYTPLSQNKVYILTSGRKEKIPRSEKLKIRQEEPSLMHNTMYRTFWYGNNPDTSLSTNGQVREDKQLLIKTLMSYVPRVVVRRFIRDPSHPIIAPEVEHYYSCVLFVDISGFTPLTESLTTLGAEGVERVSTHLNGYFSEMINLINEHGGDIVKFAGDALIVIWPTSSEDGIYPMSLLGVQCAHALQKNLGNYKVGNAKLMLHIGVGAGSIAGIHVGGAQGRLEFFVAGHPMEQVSACEAQAAPGEIFISKECQKYIKKHCVGEFVDDNFRLDGVHEPISLPQTDEFPLCEILETRLKSYVPDAVLSHLDTDDYLAELRTVSIIFVKLDILYKNHEDSAKSIQLYFASMQAILSRFEGTVRQFLIDDKGAVLIAAFGLPPISHEDDPLRAVESGLSIKSILTSMGVACGIGITTGRAFCGAVGSEDRREYAMVGDVVNLSARLMVASIKKDAILCDQATRNSTKNVVQWMELDSLSVKGKKQPVRVFVPEKTLKDVSRDQIIAVEGAKVVGRESAISLMAFKLKKLNQNKTQPGHVLVIEGEPGIGKTRLARELVDMASEDQEIFFGTCDVVGGTQMYLGSWSFIFSDILDIDSEEIPTGETLEEHICQILKSIPSIYPLPDMISSWETLAPLLNMVIPLNIADNPIVSSMSEQSRAELLQILLLRILQTRISPGSIIILDEAHYFDSPSWTLTLAACQQIKGVLFVVVLRPMKPPLPFAYQQMMHCQNANYLSLTPLTPSESVELAQQILNVSKLPPQLASQIGEKGQGLPFIIEEMTTSLKESGVIEIQGDECKIKEGAEFTLPSTVRQLITSKLDRLSSLEKSILKVASAIGRVFNVTLLSHLISDPVQKSRIHDGLASLVKAGFIVAEIEQTQAPTFHDSSDDKANSRRGFVTSRSKKKISDDESIDNLTRSSPVESQIITPRKASMRRPSLVGTLRVQRPSMLPTDSDGKPRPLMRNISYRHRTMGKVSLSAPDIGDLNDEEATEFSFRNQMTHEVVYTMMLFSQRRSLHANIAKWYEMNFPENATQYASLLGYHWKLSEKDPRRASMYYSLAGEQALRKFSNLESVSFFLEALRIEKKSLKRRSQSRIKGTPLKADAEGSSLWNLLHIHRKLGQAYYNLGNFMNSKYHLKQTLKTMKTSATPSGLTVISHQIDNKYLKHFDVVIKSDAHVQREIILALLTMGKVNYYSCDLIGASYCNIIALSIAHKADFWAEQSEAYSQCIVTAGLNHQHMLANAYMDTGKKLAQERLELVSHLLQMSGVYHCSRANWKLARRCFKQSIESCQKTADRRRLEESNVFLAFTYFLEGRTKKSLYFSTMALESARIRGDIQCQILALSSQVLCLLLMKNVIKSSTKLDQIRIALNRDGGTPTQSPLKGQNTNAYTGDISNQLNYHALTAQLYILKKEPLLAYKEARMAEDILQSKNIQPTTFFTFPAYMGVPEVYLRLLLNPKDWKEINMSHPKLLKRLIKSLQPLRDFCSVFSFATPRYYLLQGLGMLASQVDPEKVMSVWRQGYTAAEKYGLRYEKELISKHLTFENELLKNTCDETEILRSLMGERSIKDIESNESESRTNQDGELEPLFNDLEETVGKHSDIQVLSHTEEQSCGKEESLSDTTYSKGVNEGKVSSSGPNLESSKRKKNKYKKKDLPSMSHESSRDVPVTPIKLVVKFNEELLTKSSETPRSPTSPRDFIEGAEETKKAYVSVLS